MKFGGTHLEYRPGCISRWLVYQLIQYIARWRHSDVSGSQLSHEPESQWRPKESHTAHGFSICTLYKRLCNWMLVWSSLPQSTFIPFHITFSYEMICTYIQIIFTNLLYVFHSRSKQIYLLSASGKLQSSWQAVFESYKLILDIYFDALYS